MYITKYGHCCLLIEIEDTRILTDPGIFSEHYETLTNLDYILITHEHADHCHVEGVAALLTQNPNATVITNARVATLLEQRQIQATVVDGTDSHTTDTVTITACDGSHAEIIGTVGIVQNTGYLLNEEFYYPGDSYTTPPQTPRVLAAPVAGPWCKVSEAIAFIEAVAPKVVTPVHDAVLSDAGIAVTYPHFSRELEARGIMFKPLPNGERGEF